LQLCRVEIENIHPSKAAPKHSGKTGSVIGVYPVGDSRCSWRYQATSFWP